MRRSNASLTDDTLLGGLVGLLSAVTYATALGAGAGMTAFGAVLGLVAGCIGGTLVWLETAELPDEPITRAPPRDRRRRG